MTRGNANSLVKRLGKLSVANGSSQPHCSAAASSSSSLYAPSTSRSFSSSSPRGNDAANSEASSSASTSERSTGSAVSSASSAKSASQRPTRGRRARPSAAGGGRAGAVNGRMFTRMPPFKQWVTGQGQQLFGEPPKGHGPHWIGETPFPLNPYFRPPPPVSQSIRDRMWSLHSSDPKKNSIRVLSGTFGLTMERTLAILRLKALEGEMQQQRVPLQTEFQSEMERLLGSPTSLPSSPLPRTGITPPPPPPATAHDPHPADSKTKPSATSLGRIVEIDERTKKQLDEEAAAAGADSASKMDESPLTKALEEERAVQRERRASVPVGGPAPSQLRDATAARALREREFERKGSGSMPPSKGGARVSSVAGRAGFSVLDLARTPASKKDATAGKGQMESYKGAGTLERNLKKREKRAKRKEAKRGGEEVKTAKTAGVQ